MNNTTFLFWSVRYDLSLHGAC